MDSKLNYSIDIVNRITCRINSPAGIGTGVMIKIHNEDYMYFLTAKHCLLGERLNEKVDFKKIKIDVPIDENCKFVRIALKDYDDVLYDNDDENDAAVIVLKKEEERHILYEIPEIKMINTEYTELNCIFRGYPIPYNRANSIDAISINKVSYIDRDIITTETQLNTISSDSKYNCKGFSGSGVFGLNNTKYYLVGIIYEIQETFQRFRVNSLYKYDKLISNSKYDKLVFEKLNLSKNMEFVINDEIRNVMKNIEKKDIKNTNPFSKEKLRQIRELVELYKFDVASNEIDVVMMEKEYLNKNQQEELYYLKGLIVFNQGNLKMIENIKNAISSLNVNSKYIYELDYHMACEKNDQELFDTAIESLKKLGANDEDIILKIAYFEIIRENYNKVFSILCDDLGIKHRLLGNPDVHYYIGIVYLKKDNFKMAQQEFENAYKIKAHPIYKYNRIISELIPLINNLEYRIKYSNKFILRIEELSIELHKSVEYFKNLDYHSNVQLWEIYLKSLLIISPDSVIKAYDKIESNIKDDACIKSVVASAFYIKGEYNKAEDILKGIYRLNQRYLKSYLSVLEIKGDWQKISEIIDNMSIDEYDHEGIIAIFDIDRLINMGCVEKSKDRIKQLKDKYEKVAYFIDAILDLSEQINDDKIKSEFINIAIKNIEEYKNFEKLNLAKTFLKLKKYNEAKLFLKPIIYEYDKAMEYYLYILFNEAHSIKEAKKLMAYINQIYSKGYKSDNILRYKILTEFKCEDFRNALQTLQEYHKNKKIDYFYAYNNLVCKYKLGDLRNIRDESLFLLSSYNLAGNIIVARCYAELDDWEHAKDICLKAIYANGENICMEDLFNYVAMHFANMHRDKDKKCEYSEVKDGSVITLGSDKGYIKKICIHNHDELVQESGERRFECENFRKKDMISLILLSEGKKDKKILIDGIYYKVIEIIDIYVYFFRYCLTKLQNEYPNNGLFKTISARTPNELSIKMKSVMEEANKQEKKKLQIYNLLFDGGAPLSYFADYNFSNYVDKIVQLLEMEEQNFYSGEINKTENRKYVLSLSSILVMQIFGVLDKVKQFQSKCIISDGAKNMINERSYKAMTEDKAVSGSSFIDENGNLSFIKFTDEQKVSRVKFWGEIVRKIEGIESVKIEISQSKIYKDSPLFINSVDIETIEEAEKVKGVFISEDLFLKKLSLSAYNDINSNNFLGMLFSENVLSLHEKYDLILKLSYCRYLFCVNSDILVDLFINFMQNPLKVGYWIKYSKLGGIFSNILNEKVRNYYIDIYKDFSYKIRNYNGYVEVLYLLIQGPLKLKSLDQYYMDSIKKIISNEKFFGF